MRIAALLCGLIAGLFALAAPGFTGVDLMPKFLALWDAGANTQLMAKLGWQGVPGAALAGGILTLLSPGLGALLMLLAALGWIGIGVVLPEAFTIALIVPVGIAALGAGLAFVAGEIESRRRQFELRNRRATLGGAMPPPPPRPNLDDREAALRMDPRMVMREEAPPRPNMHIPLTLDEAAPVPTPPPRPSPAAPPQQRWQQPRYEAPPPPRAAAWPDPPPVVRSVVDRPAVVPPPVPPRRSMAGWVATVNGVAVLLLALGIVYLLYEDGRFDAWLAPASTAATVATGSTEPPLIEHKLEDKLPPLDLKPLGSSEPEAAPLAAGAILGEDARAPLAPPQPEGDGATVVSDVSAPIPATRTLRDPFAYCASVRTVDYVDHRYGGPRFTAEIANALRVPEVSAPDRVSWRCVDGVVMACASFDWPVCDMTPNAAEMLEFCKRNPVVPRLLAPNGTWSCEGGRPKLPEGATWPVDARGFLPSAWIPVLPGTAG